MAKWTYLMDQVLGQKHLLVAETVFISMQYSYSYMNFKSLIGLISSENPEVFTFLSFP